jgi:hypothetical protein
LDTDGRNDFVVDVLKGNKVQHLEVAEPEDVSRSGEAKDDDAEVLIECRNVYKSFGEKHILRGASFKVIATTLLAQACEWTCPVLPV